ncbi:MAG: NUDIX domain-containing protein [Candidatus Pristimantibacillus lignocellulolyticus]|uniref:NUDIX domain-containing protein n=1 Tax=Candidatus Pristimantibacillus lignocellulolyticus TaxID=2994561 RepID=A0A9J6ZCD8_9BACL|nr:MAG: NUDIX domain-containing protein [Candidatus Pristimantibacillus lignocellulolyticus]
MSNNDLKDSSSELPLILVRPTLIIYNSKAELLLVRHNDDLWGLPGGLLEPGESIEDAIRREVMQELEISVENLIEFRTFSDSRFYITSETGQKTHYVAVTYITNQFTGSIRPDEFEVLEYRYFKPKDLPENIVEMIRIILDEFIDSEQYKSI